jgi:hypothetical protein
MMKGMIEPSTALTPAGGWSTRCWSIDLSERRSMKSKVKVVMNLRNGCMITRGSVVVDDGRCIMQCRYDKVKMS